MALYRLPIRNFPVDAPTEVVCLKNDTNETITIYDSNGNSLNYWSYVHEGLNRWNPAMTDSLGNIDIYVKDRGCYDVCCNGVRYSVNTEATSLNDIKYTYIKSEELTSYTGSVGVSTWYTSGTAKHASIPLKCGYKYTIECLHSGEDNGNFAILGLSFSEGNASGNIPFSTKHTERMALMKGSKYSFTATESDGFIALSTVTGAFKPAHYFVTEEQNISNDISSLYNLNKYCNSIVKSRNCGVKGCAHRGASYYAPENTLPAYRLAAKMGFEYVECDIDLTSDNEWVLLHDSTIDRTSDHTGNVSSYTLAQLKTFDFGSWKNSKFAGTRIPTLEEFIICCRNLGLKPCIELKGGAGHIADAVNIVKKYGMLENTTWVSFTKSYLTEVTAVDANATIGWTVWTVDAAAISDAKSLRTGTNKVFISTSKSSVNATSIALCVADDIPLSAWVMDDVKEIANADPYIFMITSNMLEPSSVVYNNEIQKVIE